MQNIDLPLTVYDGETYITFPARFKQAKFAPYWSPYNHWIDSTVAEAKEDLDEVLGRPIPADPEIQELYTLLREIREELNLETNEELICDIDWKELAGSG